jgi:transposase-like protein
MDDELHAAEAASENQKQPKRGPECPSCGGETFFSGGEATHDLYAERFVCSSCGRETYRSFGRGSVS